MLPNAHSRSCRAALRAAALVALGVGLARSARAEESAPVTTGERLGADSIRAPDAPTPPPDNTPDGMHFLARHDLHDLNPEKWNAYGQATFIGSLKLPFSSAYTNCCGKNPSLNSLSPKLEGSYTGTVTLVAGLALWRGAEIYIVPEVISERPLSDLRGLGGVIQNFELQKQGTSTPKPYLSRVFLRQTIDLGGEKVDHPSAPYQLGTTVTGRRLVFTIGNFSVLDYFDKNSVVGDPRRGFFNMAFLTNSAYDFAADARGYAWGGIAELLYDRWAARIGRVTAPQQPNQLALDFRLYENYGDQIEVEHAHEIAKEPGVIRLLGYRNREYMGRFDDAIAAFKKSPAVFNAANAASNCAGNPYAPGDPYAGQSSNATAPDLCWVRRENVKLGLGLSLEQNITEEIGLFARGMYSDGQTEVYSYTSTDRSASVGAVVKGSWWSRPLDSVGLGYGVGWISNEHAAYLALGGVDGFVGDGRLNKAAEQVFEVFYSAHLFAGVWASLDYQHIANPAYNADRGPVEIFGARAHADF